MLAVGLGLGLGLGHAAVTAGMRETKRRSNVVQISPANSPCPRRRE